MQEDLTIKMGVQELLTQSEYAQIAFDNILMKSYKNNAAVFSSIHSFLAHCAVISRLLWSTKLKKNIKNEFLVDIIKISQNLKLKDRTFRNVLEHYDEYLKEWLDKPVNKKSNIFDNNIGPRLAIKSTNAIWVRHFDPQTYIFTLLDQDLNLNDLHNEIQTIKNKIEVYMSNKLASIDIWDDLDDEEKDEEDPDRLREELAGEFKNDPDSALSRMEDLCIEINELDL